MRMICILCLSLVATLTVSAQPAEAVLEVPESVEWTEIVPGLSFGAVHGAWAEEAHGKYVRMEAGMEAPVHTHSGSYHGVVIRGTVTNPYPDEEDPA